MSKTPFYSAARENPEQLNRFLGQLQRPTRQTYEAAIEWALREVRRIREGLEQER